MKVRLGFVSNSSSSSFIAVVKNLKIDDFDNAKGDIYVENDEGGEGREFEDINHAQEVLDYIKSNKEKVGDSHLEFFEVFKIIWDGGTIPLADLKDMPEDAFIYGYDAARGCADDLDDFKRYTLMEDDDED